MKMFLALMALIMMFCFPALAQDNPVSQAAAVVAAAPANAIMGRIEAHGGFQASVLLIVFVVFTGLSAFRTILYKLDGVDPGQPIPADKITLTTVNKICLFLGSVIDFIQGNTKH